MEDSAVRSSIATIINSVISRGWNVVKGKKEHRDFIRKMFNNLQMNRVFEQVLSAFWIGYSVTEKEFDQDKDNNWFIKKYITLPPKTITFKVKKNGDIERTIQDGTLIGFDEEVTFTPRRINVFIWDGGLSADMGNPYGTSALKGAYIDWFCKDWILRFKNQFLELMAGGLIVANADVYNVDSLHEQVEVLESGSAITLRKGQTIQFIHPDGDGDAFLKSLAYHDKRIREALLVPTFFGQEGSFGSAAFTAKVLDLFEQVRTRRLQQQLQMWCDHDIRQIVDQNFGQDQDEYPEFLFNAASEEQLEKRANLLLKLAKVQAIGKNDIQEMRRLTEWPEGDPGEPLITPPNEATGIDDSDNAGDRTQDAKDAPQNVGEDSEDRSEEGEDL